MDWAKFFKAYDVRGTYPEINEKVFYWTAYGLVSEILKPEGLPLQVIVMHDCRYTAEKFYKAVVAGITDAGGQAVTLGFGSTDLLYAACQLRKGPGVMITASHNPKDDNGMKMVKEAPQMLGLSSGLAKIRDFVLTKIDSVYLDQSSWILPVEDVEAKKLVWDFYKQKFLEIGKVALVDRVLAKQGKKLKVVADPGNGMGGYIMKEIADLYQNVEFVELYWELDGSFPNHPSDPSKVENMKDLMAKVKETKADLGVAFDGDADRAYFVDENGENMEGNFVVAALARSILRDYGENQNPDFNPAIVFSQPQSRSIPFTVLDCDGVAVPSKQGHTFIKAKMQNYKALYGGEGTGHHYFGEFGYMDTGPLAMAKLISVLVLEDTLPSQLVAEFGSRFFLSGEQNFKLTGDLNFETVKEKLLAKYSDGVVSLLDGVSVFYPDWKFNVRASNTEPLIRVNIECIGIDRVGEKLAEVKKVIGLA